MTKRVMSILAILMVMFVLATPALAKSKVVIKVATIAPAGTPWVTHLEKWRDNLQKATNGDMEIKIFPGGQLGNELDVLKMVQRGRISASGFSGSPIAETFPEFALMSTPFLFDKAETIDCIYDKQLKDHFTKILEKKKLKLLQWQETGWVYVYAQTDLSAPSSAKGYKIRVAQHAMSRTLWSSVSASGIELPYVETPPALQTGMVRGGESAAISYFAFGLVKVAPHFILTRHMHQAGALVMNLKQWNKLSPDQQKALKDALPDVNEMRSALRGLSEAMIKKYKDNGGSVHELTADQRAHWKKLVEPNWPAFVKSLGKEAEALWPKILEAKKACE